MWSTLVVIGWRSIVVVTSTLDSRSIRHVDILHRLGLVSVIVVGHGKVYQNSR